MLNIDKPITKRGEDFLNRTVFADNISTAIKNYDKNGESLTIGIYGKWGSGKTSIVNMTTEVLDTDDEIIVFKFEPWIYSDTQQLISHFFKEFAKAIKHTDNTQEALRIGEELETYATFFETTQMIPEPTIALVSLLSSQIFGRVGKATKKWGKLKTKSLSATKEAIEKHLTKLDKKIVIVIDDIDRLNNTEIRQIFQLIKVLGNFPNTIYMTVMDREVVVDALSEVQKGDGSEYLEKIIHVPFEVPKISKSNVLEVLLKKLNEIVSDNDFDESYWQGIFHDGLKYFFTNIRDVKRYSNILQFNYNMVGKEVNGTDLIAITALQVFEPKVYEIIKNNKEVFVGSLPDFDENRVFIDTLLKNMYSSCQKISSKNCQEFIEVLFPYSGIYESDIPDRRKHSLVCSGDFFDVYFQMTLGEYEISNNDMRLYIDSLSDEDDFRKNIDNLKYNNKIIRFLERIGDFIEDDIPEDKFQTIFHVLVDLGDTFTLKKEGVFSQSNDRTIVQILFKLARKIYLKEKRYELFKSAIENSTSSIFISCFIMIILMQEQSEIDYKFSCAGRKMMTLTVTDYEQLKTIIVKKIIEWKNSNNLFEHIELSRILYLWKEYDKEGVKSFIEEEITDNNKLLKLLDIFIYTSNNPFAIQNTEEFNYKNLKEFIDVDSIKEQIEELDKNFDKYETTDKSRFVIDEFLKQYRSEKESENNA